APPFGLRWSDSDRWEKCSLCVDPPGADVLEAVAAVYWFPCGRPKRHLGGLAAGRTDGLMEFPGWRRGQRRNARRRSGLPLLLVAAAPAAGRFVLEPALLIEGLLSQGEHELFATVATLDYL